MTILKIHVKKEWLFVQLIDPLNGLGHSKTIVHTTGVLRFFYPIGKTGVTREAIGRTLKILSVEQFVDILRLQVLDHAFPVFVR
jgi:hypothetical protein